jgi:hypothetical protein
MSDSHPVAEDLLVGTKACLDTYGDMKIKAKCADPPATTTTPVTEPAKFYTVKIALNPQMKAYREGNYWYADTTNQRSDSYWVAQDLVVGTQACLDMSEMKVKSACADAPVAPTTDPATPTTETIVEYTVEVALKPGMRAVERNGYWFASSVATEGYEVAEALAVGTTACLDKND